MSSFALAIPHVLRHEGGWVDDPDDPGGATNYGISLRFAKGEGLDFDGDGDVDADDVRGLTQAQAGEVYRERFWERHGYEQIADQRIAAKVFDTCVNVGPIRAHRFLQRALCAVGCPVATDGVLGPKTIAATNRAEPATLVVELIREQANFYRTLAELKPRLAKFLGGWMRRARWDGG
jgi:lysozyme family protein